MVTFPQCPISFDVCPNCGSTQRVATKVLESEQEQGRCMEANTAYLFQHQSLIAPPSMRFLSAQVILSYFDACLDCGTVYLVHAETKTAVQGIAPSGGKPAPYQPKVGLS